MSAKVISAINVVLNLESGYIASRIKKTTGKIMLISIELHGRTDKT